MKIIFVMVGIDFPGKSIHSWENSCYFEDGFPRQKAHVPNCVWYKQYVVYFLLLFKGIVRSSLHINQQEFHANSGYLL